MVKNKGKTQFYEKHCKNNEKLMTRFGSRTSTLARGLRPIHPGYYNGETQRGNKKGTQREKNGKMKKSNEKKRKFHIF